MEAGRLDFPKKAAKQQLFPLVICSSEVVWFRARIMKLWTTTSQGSPNWIRVMKYLTSTKDFLKVNHQKLAQTPKCYSPVAFLARRSRVTPCDSSPSSAHTCTPYHPHTLCYPCHYTLKSNKNHLSCVSDLILLPLCLVVFFFFFCWTHEVYGHKYFYYKKL